MKAPAFQFYPADFMMGTLAMPPDQVGGYIRLLCYQWEHGPIQDDSALLCRITGCTTDAVASIRHKFGICQDGSLANERLEKVRAAQLEYRKKQAERAVSRWEKAKSSNSAMPAHMPAHMPESCSLSLSLSSEDSLPAPAKQARKRDELFDCLAKAEGSNPVQLTKRAARTVAVAIAEIRKASPDVTPEEIARRAERYRRVMPQGSTLTASALAKHWARCGEVVRLATPAPILQEPANWRATLKRLFPDSADDLTWATLPDSIRQQVRNYKPPAQS